MKTQLLFHLMRMNNLDRLDDDGQRDTWGVV